MADSDHTGRMHKSDLSFSWAHSHFVGFVTRRLRLKFVIFRLNENSGSGNVEYLAFTGVKLHAPGSFPTLQRV